MHNTEIISNINCLQITIVINSPQTALLCYNETPVQLWPKKQGMYVCWPSAQRHIEILGTYHTTVKINCRSAMVYCQAQIIQYCQNMMRLKVMGTPNTTNDKVTLLCAVYSTESYNAITIYLLIFCYITLYHWDRTERLNIDS